MADGNEGPLVLDEEWDEGEGEEEEPFIFPPVEDPHPWKERTYPERGGLVIEQRFTDVERANKNASNIDAGMAAECGDGDGTLRKYSMDYQNAKALLLQQSALTGENLYDHLARIISRVIETQPPDVVDILEDLSKQLKFERFSGRGLEKHVQDLKIDDYDPILDVRDPSKTVELANLQLPLLLPSTGEGEDDFDLDLETLPMPNFLELAFYMHQAMCGFSTDELFRIGLSVKKLIASEPLRKVRLWGKIIGTDKNYTVIEAEWQDGEGDFDEEGEDEGDQEDYHLAAELDAAVEGEGEGAEDDGPPLPVNKWHPPPIIPKEINTGVNKFAYYVTSEIGEPWVRLPMVTPEQIQCSRKIRKSFTGDLERPIITYPPFPGPKQEKKHIPGLEKHYLRCQIARISASTHVSPMGYFNFGEEGEAEGGGGGGADPMENPHFQGIPVVELADSSLENWVHHVSYILPQGRITWFNPNPAGEGEDEGEGGGEIDIYAIPAEPEFGPPLLTTIAADEPYEEEEELAWSSSLSSATIPQYGLAIVRNNRWPGAVSLSTGKKFFNIYVGSGLKYLKGEFQPELPTMPWREYPVGPEIEETVDPTPEEEEALRKLLEKKVGEGGEGGEGGGGEDEDEDDD